jgi:hypothetical protein
MDLLKRPYLPKRERVMRDKTIGIAKEKRARARGESKKNSRFGAALALYGQIGLAETTALAQTKIWVRVCKRSPHS